MPASTCSNRFARPGMAPLALRRRKWTARPAARRVRAAGAIRTWFERIAGHCAELLLVMEPWQFETLDMPEFRAGPCAAERTADIIRLTRSAQQIQRTYYATIVTEEGFGERTFTFEDSPALIDGPVDMSVKAILDHIIAAGQPGEPFSYRVTEATRHGDMLILKGAVPTGRREVNFIAIAFAA